MRIRAYISLVIIAAFFSCSPYALLTAKQQKFLKKDYASRVEIMKIVGENIHLGNQDTLLDIASGYGVSISILSNYLPEQTKYFVEDINRKSCSKLSYTGLFKLVESKAKIENFQFFYGKENTLPFPSNSFNNATLFISIHEFKQKEAMLEEAARCLRKKGKLFILETVAHDGFQVKDNNCGYYYISDKQLQELLKKTNFKTLKDTIVNKMEPGDTFSSHFLIVEKGD